MLPDTTGISVTVLADLPECGKTLATRWLSIEQDLGKYLTTLTHLDVIADDEEFGAACEVIRNALTHANTELIRALASVTRR